MPLIPAHLLASHRDKVIDYSLPDLCAILRITTTTDEIGGEINVAATVALDIPTRYTEDLSTREQTTIMRQELEVTARVTLPANTDVTENDWIALTVDGVDIGDFNVKAVMHRSWELARTLLVARGNIPT